MSHRSGVVPRYRTNAPEVGRRACQADDRERERDRVEPVAERRHGLSHPQETELPLLERSQTACESHPATAKRASPIRR